jgi:hypothetical protein
VPTIRTTPKLEDEEPVTTWGTDEDNSWAKASAGAAWDDVLPSTQRLLQERQSLSSRAFRKERCIHSFRFHSHEDECWQCRVDAEMIFEIKDKEDILRVMSLFKDTKLPVRATPGPVVYDLFAYEPCAVQVNQVSLISLDFTGAFIN